MTEKKVTVSAIIGMHLPFMYAINPFILNLRAENKDKLVHRNILNGMKERGLEPFHNISCKMTKAEFLEFEKSIYEFLKEAETLFEDVKNDDRKES
jgi:hypothetical protein